MCVPILNSFLQFNHLSFDCVDFELFYRFFSSSPLSIDTSYEYNKHLNEYSMKLEKLRGKKEKEKERK